MPRTLTVTRSAPATTWALVAIRPGATTQPLPTWACPQSSDSARTWTTEARARVTSGSAVAALSGASTGAIGSGPRPSNTFGKTLRSRARVTSWTRPSADAGMISSRAVTTTERETRSRASRRTTGAHRPGHDPHHEHGGDEHGQQAQRGVDGPGRRGAHHVAQSPREEQHQPLAAEGEADDGGDQREHPHQGRLVDAGVVLEQRGHEPHGEEGATEQPGEPEQGRHEPLAPAAPGVEGQQAQQGQVEGHRPAHSRVPRIHGDMTRSGSGRSRAVSQGRATPASSNRLLSSIAVNPHTNRSPTSNAGPR